MKIANDIRAIEAHVKSLSTDKATQLAMISQVQAMVADKNEYSMAVLIVAKNRIRKAQ